MTYPVVVTIADAPATLRSGMSADVTITIASATNVLTVPAAALRGSDGDYSVLVLGADGSAAVAGGRGRPGHEDERRDHERPDRGAAGRHRDRADLAGSNATGGWRLPGRRQVTRGFGGGGHPPAVGTRSRQRGN